MNLKKLIIIIVLLNIYLSARSQSGSIFGKVTGSETGEVLPGASIKVRGTNNGTATDLQGEYSIRNVTIGERTLEVYYMGYESTEVSVNVMEGKTAVANIKLKSQVSTLGEVVVTGQLEGQQKALNQQRSADNIKNIVSIDLISRFPDLNVAEALQRVPGININRDKGEGSEVSVRGTPSHFTSIQINGEQIPSVQQGGSRNEALDLIPADQLSSMEITKAPTPDMDGDAIGGVVNLRTPTAKDKDLELKLESAVGFNDISGGVNGIGKISINQRFLSNSKISEGRLGILGSASYYSTDNSEDRIDADWQGIERPIENLERDTTVLANYQYRKTENQRERIGATFTLDFKFNDKNSIIFNYMYNRREDNDLRNRLRFDTDRSGSTWASLDSIRDGRMRRDINFWDEVKSNQSFNLEGNHTFSSWQIDWGAFYTFSNRTYNSDRGDFARDELDLVVNSPNGIYSQIPTFDAMDPELNIHNPLLLNDFRRYEEDFETTDATNLVGRFDISNFFTLLGRHDAYIKFGSKIRMQTNSKFRDNVVFAINDPNNILRSNETFLRVIDDAEPKNFLFNNVRFGPKVGRSAFENYISDNRAFFATANNAWDSERLSLSDTYDAFEDIYSTYAMGRFQINNLMILAGLRYEYNDVGYEAFEVIREGTTVSGTPVTGGNNYGFLLPNIHFKYSFNSFTALRLSSVFNYARPNFVDLVPFVNFDADAVRLSLGNPDLQPANAFNLDAMIERYFANVGIFSLGAFYKNINQFQFSRVDPSLAEDFPGYPNTQGFEFLQEQNGENAIVAGLELNIVRALDFLPGILGNLNLYGNYTYAYSDAFTQDRDNISLPGQAEHTANGALSFDYKDFSARVSLNYNGEFVNSLASQRRDDIVEQERLQVDMNASYNISNKWRIYVEVVNLTNAPSIRYQGIKERVSRIAYFGWWSRVGISFKL
ncbi:MAG: TonB-dependent receptor [Cyclobacteriaceae bacterium]